MTDKMIGAPDALRLVNEQHGAAVSYWRLYQRILAGDVPVTRDGGRYFVRKRDLPAIARALGLDSGKRGEASKLTASRAAG